MTKLQKIALFSLLVLVALLVYVEATKPQPINWFESYSRMDKIPFGTYVLHDLLNEKLDENFIETNRPPFEVLADTSVQGTYFFTNNYISIYGDELDKLLRWTEKGNTLFIASNSFSRELLDTLSLKEDRQYSINTLGTQPMLELVNENLKINKPYLIERDLSIGSFSELDTLTHIVLGNTEVYHDTLKLKDPKPNFIKAPFGKGYIFLHLQPEVFTNYFLLEKDNVEYTEGVLAYINSSDNFYWDNHYKSGKPIETSPLYILLNNKNLKWAYYFMLIGALLFVLFEGKRKQRKIPVVIPPANKTYEYTRTIAGMYYDQKDHKAIAEKQIALFMEYIRTRLRIPTEQINTRFFTQVAARSGNTPEDTKALFTFMEQIQHSSTIAPETLLKLNKEITTYKNITDGKS
ncbi:DUF4350 domain-containing protein [Rasiella sp. SM2506]|uniref:DUF4350 domain-containing protein n=1 Tax=Rasiella sp. SM2506 TaxID=3423914 RepID=UPI003D792198